jgi:hypothetical protein
MRKAFFNLFIVFGIISVNAQTAENPFAKYGFKKVRAYSFSKGEFEEFHDNKEIVEIGSVLFDTKTNQVVGYISEETENDVDAATSAMTVDPLCEKYPWISPYAYCLNNPVNAIDPDGRLVIFINGMHTGSGGTKNYWGDNGAFANAAMKHLNDYNAMYRDGSVGGWSNIKNNRSAAYRIFRGQDQGKLDAANIIKSISDNDGNLTETIKIITHSMGAAYAKGYIKSLLEYFKKNNISTDFLEFEADFAPYQPTKQQAVDGIDTYQFSHSKDGVAGNKKMEGTKYMDTSSDKNQTHWIQDFTNQIQNLPEGKYKIENGKLVPY